MRSSSAVVAVIGQTLAFCVIIRLSQAAATSIPRCEFDLESEKTVDTLVRCYSLKNLSLLESFIEDDRPVKVQVVNGPLDKFHLTSARSSSDYDGG